MLILGENNKNGQSVLEYAVIIAVIVLALGVMQAYVRRGLQGKFKVVADDLGQQYNPQNTTSELNLILEGDIQTETFTSIKNETDTFGNTTWRQYEETVTNTTFRNDTQIRRGSETVGL